jgi:hypothetical protein
MALGIPCMHACSAITHQCRKPEDYCDGLLSFGSYHATYQFFIKPTNSQEFWEKTPYLKPSPPNVKRSAGRPKKNRRKDGNECDVIGGKLKRSYNVWTCSICKQEGHNSRGCLHKPPVPVGEARAEGVEVEEARDDGQEVRDEVAEARADGQQPQGSNVQVAETQTEIPLSQSRPFGDQPSQEAETSRPSKKV